MWEPAISGMGNAHNCAPKLQAYPPIFSLTPKASGSTRLQSCEVHEDRKKAIKAGMNAHIAKPISADIILENLERMRQSLFQTRSNAFDENRKYFNEPAEKS